MHFDDQPDHHPAHRSEPADPPTGRQAEPVDPDTAVDPWPPQRDPGPRRRQAEILGAIAAGGVIGACARYGATLLWPTAPGTFPWTTFWINVTGCAAMGLLMVLITERTTAHPLVRPFLSTGLLGGYTTFSTYAVDAQHLIDDGQAGTALLYLAATLAAALLAVWATAALTRLVAPPRPARDGGRA
ncbi:fluoride efflux transporter CrcB [Streptomyces sp. TG1A-60]|uniref:fluoride efflux transporter CrcB n=1 Tax=Streptomyces sp. TG1A-60 TaxID=3129111 RepID=UPI0030D4BDF1